MRHRKTSAVVLLAVAGATLTGCGMAATSTPASAVKTQVATTCHQQYQAWKTGPAKAQAGKLTSALTAIQTAASSDDTPLLQSGIEQAGSAARQLQAYPIPACADPAGYWNQTLADIRAAGDNAGTSTGLGGLIAAEIPLKKVPPLETKFDAELKTTAG